MHCANDHHLHHSTTVSPIYAVKPDKQHSSPNKTACLPPACKHLSQHMKQSTYLGVKKAPWETSN